MSREAWGRWGDDDEIGAVNQIGPRQRLDAVATVVEGRVLSLAQQLNRRTPRPEERHAFGRFMVRDGGDYAAGARRPGGFQFAEDVVMLSTHAGTHVDALSHAWYDDQLYNGHSADTIGSLSGATRCGIEVLPPIVGRGVLLDLVGEGTPLPRGHAISQEDLEVAAADSGVTFATGDIVLVRTGWLEANERDADFSGEAGLTADAGIWLAERGAAAIGADNYAVECIPFPHGTVFPLHQRLIRDFGMTLIEGLRLEELARTGRSSFLFVAAPLPITGGTGGPANPVAVL